MIPFYAKTKQMLTFLIPEKTNFLKKGEAKYLWWPQRTHTHTYFTKFLSSFKKTDGEFLIVIPFTLSLSSKVELCL